MNATVPHLQPLLRLLFWETTIRCNLACAYCRRVQPDEAVADDMSNSQAGRLIEQLAELGRTQSFMPLLVFSGGEPLLRDDIFELARRTRAAGLTPALATNGTLIDAAAAEAIGKSGFARVAISLDAAAPEMHDRMRGVELAFERSVTGIGQLGERQIPFQINFTLAKANVGQLDKVHELAGRLGAAALHIFMVVPVGCARDLRDDEQLSAQEYEQAMLRIVKLQQSAVLPIKVTCGPHYERVVRQQGADAGRGHFSYSGSGVDTAHKTRSRGCLAGLGVLFVSHRGDVFPCGYLPVKCGNVMEESLLQIWGESEHLRRMRDSDALEGKCGICKYRYVCGGCRARAYAATGNYMASEPFCIYDPAETPNTS